MRLVEDTIKILTEKQYEVSILENELKVKQEKVKNLTNDISVENNLLDGINNVLLACKLILEKITYQNKAKIEQFITYALQNIFTDRDYSIELEIKEDVKRPALTIMLVENGIKQDIKDAVGGGIITTLGFLLQIYYLEVYNKNKIMFIDEGLKEISKVDEEQSNVDYLSNLLLFLKWLSDERGYRFVIVTHDDSIRKVANKVYSVKNGDVNTISTTL